MAVNVISTIIFSAMAGATILAIISILHRPEQSSSRRDYFLLALFVLLLFHALGELLLASGGYRFAPHLAGIQLPVRMLLGPALYFYAHSMMSSEPINTLRSYGTALLGPVVIVAIMLPFASLSAEQKLSLVDPVTRDAELYRLALTTCAATAIIFASFTAAYLIAAYRLQSKHRKRMMERYANIETRSLDWLRIILLVWGAVWLLFTIDRGLWVLSARPPGLGTILAISEALALITFAHLALNQPTLSEPKTQTPCGMKKAREPTLQQARMERIAEKLKSKMREERLFAENDLSLRHLADATGTSENHLSETFSQYLNTNFFQFVNEYRINEAKQMLELSQQTITAIAFEVGYNSRSTFNSAFKRETGLTPSNFRLHKSAHSDDKPSVI